VLVGASTLRWLISPGHGWPHDDLPTWLASHDADLAKSVKPTGAAFCRVEGDLTPALDEMEENAHRRIWLAGGGAVAAQVLELDRLTEVIATIAPTALGLGPALFDAPALPLRSFELVECRPVGAAACASVRKGIPGRGGIRRGRPRFTAEGSDPIGRTAGIRRS
jgi:riboflavin biosynthesis pyrimidine reductase